MVPRRRTDIEQRMRLLGFTQQTLARAAGLHVNTVQRYLSGGTHGPNALTVAKIERALRKAEGREPDSA